MIVRRLRDLAAALLPIELRHWMRAQQRRYRLQRVRVGTIDFGDLRRVSPISDVFSLDRGQPVERYYIERFLSACSMDIGGHVLEIGDDHYTRRFGSGRVTRCDVLHVVCGNPKATIVADLTRAEHIPSDLFDCIVFTQTLQMIYEVRPALRHLHRILKPGGVLLATSHGISRIGRWEGVDPWGEYWHFTSQSTKHLFEEVFQPDGLRIQVYGNVLAAVASLHGVAAQELTPDELDHSDPAYEVLVGVRAQKGLAQARADV
jgi:SAM-dependent methyltransferase